MPCLQSMHSVITEDILYGTGNIHHAVLSFLTCISDLPSIQGATKTCFS